jgi:flavorubredoxin
MAVELYRDAHHLCLLFSDMGGSTQAVSSNQFLIVNRDTGAIIDPGGNMAYNELYLGMTRYFPPQKLAAIVASHADPDIIASLDRWMTATTANLYISEVWERFAPHFCKPGKTDRRIVPIADAGMRIPVGDAYLLALPAHFLHAEGNFQFYDPVSRILFSGDMGANFASTSAPGKAVDDITPLLPSMTVFHQRYMVSGRILRYWARMVSSLHIDMIVPQHGVPMKGAAVRDFIHWVQTLECGIDLMSEANYRLPA